LKFLLDFIFFWLEVHLLFFCSPCSKAILMFEDDERFKAVERPREREDLFENYLVELHKKVLRY
jgi:pre-mRNA-processing factor 40